MKPELVKILGQLEPFLARENFVRGLAACFDCHKFGSRDDAVDLHIQMKSLYDILAGKAAMLGIKIASNETAPEEPEDRNVPGKGRWAQREHCLLETAPIQEWLEAIKKNIDPDDQNLVGIPLIVDRMLAKAKKALGQDR